jgi:EmrB/QacA subfamily drug resistance transporter
MIGFMAFSWLCGASWDMNSLIFFRGAQGLFGGMLFASVFTVLADVYSPAQRARMQGVFGGVFGLSSIVGPFAGGWLTDNWGWRWVFFVNVPVGVLAVILILAFLPFVRTKASWRDIDFWGAIALAAGLTPILVGLTLTNTHSWSDPIVWGSIAGGLVMIVVFLVIEHFEPEPIVPLTLWLNRTYTVSTIVGILTAFGMFGTIIFVPLVYQGVLGVSATNSGTLITPMMIGMIGMSIVTGQLMVRIKWYRFLGTAGALIMAGAFYLLSEVSVNTTQLQVTACLVLIGAGMGISFPLYINALQSAVEPKFLGVVTSNTQFWRNVGGTIATAILGSILANRLPANINDKVTALNLPPQMRSQFHFGGGASAGSAGQLFDQAALAAQRAKLPPQVQPLFDQVIVAIKAGLAATLHELFLIAVVALLLAAVASVFMPYVPLRRTARGIPAGEAPPVPGPAREAATA